MFIGISSLITTGILWVVLGIVISRSAQKNQNLSRIQGVAGLLIVLISLPGLFFAPFPGTLTSICIMLSGVGNYCIFHLMNRAMKTGPNGLTWAMIQSAFTIPFIMGIVFFSVPCSHFKLAGIILLLAATALMGILGKKRDAGNCISGKWLIFTVSGFILAALNQCCANLPSYFLVNEKINFWGLLVRGGIGGFGTAAAWGIHSLFSRKNLHGGNCINETAAMALSTLAASITLFCGLDKLAASGVGSIGYPIAMGTTIAVFQLYSFAVLREKFSFLSTASIMLCMAGIVMLTV